MPAMQWMSPFSGETREQDHLHAAAAERRAEEEQEQDEGQQGRRRRQGRHRGGEGRGQPTGGGGLGGLGGRGEAVQHDLEGQRERRRHLGILQVDDTNLSTLKCIFSCKRLREFRLQASFGCRSEFTQPNL